MKSNLIRLAFGLIVLVSVDLLLYAAIGATLLSRITDSNSFFVWMVTTDFTVLFLATAAGGYIARTNLIVPAMIYAGAEFLFGVYRGLRLANNSGPIMFSELDYLTIPLLLLAMVTVLAIAAAGSATGMKLASVTGSGRARPA